MKKKFKDLSLKKKLLLFYSVLFLLPLILISSILYYEVSESMLEKIRYSAEKGYEQASSYMEYKVTQMIQKTDVVVTSSSLKDRIEAAARSRENPHEQLRQKEAIRSYLQSVEVNSLSMRMKIYLKDNGNFLADGGRIFSLSEADQALWYQKKGKQNVYFSPGIYLEPENQKNYVALVRDISEEENYQKRYAVLRMDIDIEEFTDILRNASTTENSVTYLVDRENQMVAVSDWKKFQALGLEENLPEEFAYDKYSDSTELTSQKIQERTVYCLRDKIRNTDWKMVTVIPKKDLTEGIRRVQYMVAGLMILFGMLTIFGGTVIISWIVRRITRLQESFHQVKSGKTRVYLPNDTRDEIGVLYDNYNEMMAHTNQLMEEKYQMGLQLKSAELKALQSQINPHFLYNTLDMVNWLAYGGKTEEIHQAVVSLSKYYRLILNKGQDTLSLKEELQHVGYYIKIQDIRFPGKLRYLEEVEEEILKSTVPKIILQPLVENAILHGLWEKTEKAGTIKIQGFVSGKDVIIRVMDDGVGMDEEKLSHVLDGSLVTSGSGYGVKNVHARLKLMFGEAYGLTYKSKPGEGTCVTVRIPK